jgi:AcrR family transcriptional regulator
MNMRSARRERRREADRRDLLAAAERVFGRVGYAAASMRDIAREASVSVGGEYQLVPSKDDLYVAVLDRVWADYQGAIAPALAAGSFEQRLHAVTRAALAFFAQRRAFMSLLLAERGSFTPAFHDRVARVINRHKRVRRRQIVELMKLGIHERCIRFTDPDLLASAYLGLVSQCNIDALMAGGRRPLPSPDALVSLFVHGSCQPAA